MLKKCLKTITEYNMLEKGDKVIVGLSGGADSCALLHILWTLKDEFSLDLTAVHINHGIRGDEADADEAFSREFCNKLGIKFVSESYDIPKIAKEKGIGSEEAGRFIRYEAFERIGGENAKIAVAHNLNDRAETVIMRLARGSGIKGLIGILPKRGNIIRPLIDCERSEIEAYCAKNGIDFVTDSTNNADIYTRNKVRLNIMPLIEKELNQNAIKNIAKAAKMAEEENAFLEEETQKAFNACILNTFEKNIVYLDVCILKKCHKAIIKRVIKKALVCVSGAEKDIYSKNVEDVFSLLDKGTGKSVNLPYGVKAEMVYDKLKLSKCADEDKKDIIYALKIGETTYIKEIGKNILISEEKVALKTSNLCTKTFNYGKIRGSLALRNRKEGDFLRIFPSGGRKKLKDFFIDKKIPREERDNILLVAAGSEVIWIPDLWTSKYLEENAAENVLYVYIWEDA